LRRFVGGSTLAVAALFAWQPAQAQVRQNDVRATASIDLYYALSPQWSLNYFSEGQLDHNVSRAADFLFRPNLQYHFAEDWNVNAGYVQFQPIQATFRTERGAFQDLVYHHSWGEFAVYNRARVNETFADQSSAMLVTASNFIDLHHSIGASAWFAEIYDEPFFNLKVDGTGRTAGFQLNKSYVGVGYNWSPKAYTTLGYELSTIDVAGTLFTAHIFKFGLIVHLN
jgi:Protein of unknown function (DUF2490)